MVCPAGGGPIILTRLVVTPDTKPGDDVACDYALAGGNATLFAARLGSTGLQSYAAGVFAAIAKLFPTAKPMNAPMIVNYPDLSRPIAAAFGFVKDGKPYITSAWVSQERGWAIEMRATYPAEPRHDPEFAAAMFSMYAQYTVLHGAD